MRLHFIASTVQENRESTEAELGADVDFFVGALTRRRPTLLFRLDESKNRVIMVRTGYHYLPSYTGSPSEDRGIFEATARTPLIGMMGDLLVSDRNRVDLRSIQGDSSWRYRNRLSVERELSLGCVRMNPYGRFEIYYDSRFDAWSRTQWTAGVTFPINKSLELESYFDFQRDTGGASIRHTKAVGLVISFYL